MHTAHTNLHLTLNNLFGVWLLLDYENCKLLNFVPKLKYLLFSLSLVTVLGRMQCVNKYKQIHIGHMGIGCDIDGARQFIGCHEHCMEIIGCGRRLLGHVGGVGRWTHRKSIDAIVER